jgi:anti-sigma factor RsiW
MTNSTTTSCKDCREHLPDLLLDPTSVPAAVETHIAACTGCREELASLRATFAALDAWTAPEPSAYFDTRLHARVREAQAAPPEGFFERMRSFLLFSTGRSLRPAVAGALALALIASGGSFIGIHGFHGSQPPQASATVNDLKILDNNDQALQQMGQLLDDNDDSDTPPTT